MVDIDVGLNIDIIDSMSCVVYTDLLKTLGDFISLDISVQSTGYVICIDGKMEHGVYSLETDSDLERRQEFKRFLRKLIGGKKIDYLLIEDIIGGKNFETSKGLIQLNTIADDLLYDGEFECANLLRVGNTVWKRSLKDVASYKSEILKENDKLMIVNVLKSIGFPYELKSRDCREGIEQDIFDAYGLACGVAWGVQSERNLSNSKKGKKRSLDIGKGYMLKQYKDRLSVDKYINRWCKDKEVVNIGMLNIARDLRSNFKKYIKDVESIDDKVFIIKIDSSKLGLVGIEKKLDLNMGECYLIVKRK